MPIIYYLPLELYESIYFSIVVWFLLEFHVTYYSALG